MKIAIVLGTRPEIIKMAPVIDEITKNDYECILIHTGQHYDIEMSKQFFEDLNIKVPDYNIGIGSKTAIQQISIIIAQLEEILSEENVDIVLVQGDTNTVLAGALASNKLKIPVGHVEAGLRSFDKNMPEETNRIIADNCSELYFVPTKETAINLQNEGIDHNKIHITGNTIVDACFRHKDIAKEKSMLKEKIIFNEYIALTMHRAENVDDPERLTNIINALLSLDKNIVFPIHPHTRKSLEELDLYEKVVNSNNIQVTNPLGYLDFLYLISNSQLILTDSGGVQEEAITLSIPCITLRYNTERPETITAGGNILAGTTSDEISRNINNILNNPDVYKAMQNASNPYGDGSSSKQILKIIKNCIINDTLNVKKADSITDFIGYKKYSVKNDITVVQYEKTNNGHIIEQVFDDENPVCICDDLNLNGLDIIVKIFKTNN